MTKKTPPKVIFKQMTLKLETEMFFEFLKGDWSRMITDKYPEFPKIKNIVSKEEKVTLIKNEILKIRGKLEKKLEKNLEIIKSGWQKVEKECFKCLSEITQEDWPSREIIAYISLNPICPRYLNSWSFSLTYDCMNPSKTIAHEISHFLFFKKFSKIFPEINTENYEAPYKEWLLSELVAIIIQNDPRMIKIQGEAKSDFYSDHKKLKINDRFVTNIIKELYDEYVINKNDFEEFIKKSLELLKDLK